MLCREYRLKPAGRWGGDLPQGGLSPGNRLQPCRCGALVSPARQEYGQLPGECGQEMNGKKEELDMTKDELLSIEKTGDKPSSWAKASAEKAKRKGLLTGDGKGDYGWQVPLTTERLAVILDRAGVLVHLLTGNSANTQDIALRGGLCVSLLIHGVKAHR